jgi:hypothetical protein
VTSRVADDDDDDDDEERFGKGPCAFGVVCCKTSRCVMSAFLVSFGCHFVRRNEMSEAGRSGRLVCATHNTLSLLHDCAVQMLTVLTA